MKTSSIFSRIVVLLLAGAIVVFEHSARADAENARNYIEMMRSDLNSAKVDTINRVLKLNESEAKKFWPLYKEYEGELAKLADQRLRLIETFVQAQRGAGLDAKQASDISTRWFNLQQSRLELWRKYHDKFAQAVSPVRAAQFVQVEHEVALLVDISIASEMPSIENAGGKAAETKP